MITKVPLQHFLFVSLFSSHTVLLLHTFHFLRCKLWIDYSIFPLCFFSSVTVLTFQMFYYQQGDFSSPPHPISKEGSNLLLFNLNLPINPRNVWLLKGNNKAQNLWKCEPPPSESNWYSGYISVHLAVTEYLVRYQLMNEGTSNQNWIRKCFRTMYFALSIFWELFKEQNSPWKKEKHMANQAHVGLVLALITMLSTQWKTTGMCHNIHFNHIASSKSRSQYTESSLY